MTKYLGEWAEFREPGHPLINEEDGNYNGFDVTTEEAEEIKNLNIIVAAYGCDGYDGDAFVLFEKDGKLFEVNDSHCSCSNLNNWDPEETSKEALLLRLKNEEDSIYRYGVWKHYFNELKQVIEGLPDDNE